MYRLFAIVAFIGLTHSPVLAWTGADAHRPISNHAERAPQVATLPLLPVAFPKPVAINRASVVIVLDQATIFIDPVGNQAQYERFGRPDIVVLTQVHPDHLSIDTMIGMLRRDTVVLAPQAVIDQLPLMIANNVIAPFDIGSTQEVDGIMFRALAGSAAIPGETPVYPRDRGDIGVVIAVDGDSGYF